MKASDALRLLAPAVVSQGGVWADFGAGTGTFTRALAQLIGAAGLVYAIDRDARALAELAARPPAPDSAPILTVAADFTTPFELPGAERGTLDGLLFANALHFVEDAGRLLRSLCAWLSESGRVVLVEYDRRAASRWVPFPIGIEELPALAAAAGLTGPQVLGRRRSAYAGELYVAAAQRPVK